jgi:hypothetical protein
MTRITSRHKRVVYRPRGDDAILLARPAVIAADRVLRHRLGTAMNENVRRGRLEYAMRLRDAFLALARVAHCTRRQQKARMASLMEAVRRVEREFDEGACDEATLTAAHEVEGLVFAVLTLTVALAGINLEYPDPFDSSVPAERDPTVGPEIRARAAEWRQARSRKAARLDGDTA